MKQILGKEVLLEVDNRKEVMTDSGIIIPVAKTPVIQVKVLKKGIKCSDDSIKVGSTVLIQAHMIKDFEVDGEIFHRINEEQIMAIIG